MNKGAEDQEGAGVGWVVGEAETSRGSSFYNILPPVVQHYPNSFLGFYFAIAHEPSQFQSKDLPAGKTLLTLGDGLASKREEVSTTVLGREILSQSLNPL